MPEARQNVGWSQGSSVSLVDSDASIWLYPLGGVSVTSECLSLTVQLVPQTCFSSQGSIHHVPKFRNCLGICQSARKQIQQMEDILLISQVWFIPYLNYGLSSTLRTRKTKQLNQTIKAVLSLGQVWVL